MRPPNRSLQHHRSTRSRQGERRRGFTLIEVVMGGSILVTAVLLTCGSILTSMNAGSLSRESVVASEAAQQKIEELRQAEFVNLFALYNQDGSDDPEGVDTAPGGAFEVAGLSPRSDDADGFVGEVVLPNTDAAPTVLREDLAQPFGRLDLDGDGAIDGDDHSADYVLLPVKVVVSWSGSAGESRVELVTLLSNY